MNNRIVLASNIRTLMKKTGIRSQAKLARVTGVSQTQIGNILRHEKAASIDMLERLANGLNCEPWFLLAPINIFKEIGDADFTPLVYCYLKLPQDDQDAVWDMTHQLFEAANGFYKPKQ